jgi:hypothetical protein
MELKRLFGAIIVGTMVAGAVFASASALPLVPGTGSVQSSVLASVTCQNTPIEVGYGVELNGEGENQIDHVILSNIDAACIGALASIQLLQADPPYSGLGGPGNMVWYSWDTITAAGTMNLYFGTGHPSPKPLVREVNHFNLMFSGQ